MNVKVFSHTENPLKSTSCKHISKSAAEKWVSAGTHYWFKPRRILHGIDPKKRVIARCSIGYIPEKMPPREVPGVFFQEPQSDQWKLAHRMVTI